LFLFFLGLSGRSPNIWWLRFNQQVFTYLNYMHFNVSWDLFSDFLYSLLAYSHL